MSSKIYFKTKDFNIQSWLESDIPSLWREMNNVSVSSGFRTPYPYTLDDAKKYIEKVKKHNHKKSLYFAVKTKSNILVGGGGLYYRENNSYSIGLWISEKMQSKGYGTQIVKKAVEYAFDVLMAENVFIEYYSINIKSENIAKRLKFKYLETFITEIDGEEKIKMVLNKNEYLNENK